MMGFLRVLLFVLLAAAGVDSFRSLPPATSQDSPWRNENAGLYKEAKVTRMGHYGDTIILSTERGEVEVRAALGSWIK